LFFHNRRTHSAGTASQSEFTGNVSEVAAYQDRDVNEGEASSRKLASPSVFLGHAKRRIADSQTMPNPPKSKSIRAYQPDVDLRPVALLTGFGPFPGVAENVTGRLIAAVARPARIAFPGYVFNTRVLPTEWQAAPKRVEVLFRSLKPVLALHFGVSKEANGFRLETQGLNICRGSEDAAGCMPLAPELVADGASAYAATLAVERIARRLAASGFPVSISDDAGGYLCNAVLYHALHTVAVSGHPCRVGFVHISAAPNYPSRPPLLEF
jgi:pyroglutamyl-peptidase